MFNSMPERVNFRVSCSNRYRNLNLNKRNSSLIEVCFIVHSISFLENHNQQYSKLSYKHCWDDRKGSYSTIDKAKDACNQNTDCKGVYVQDCNADPNNIYLCPSNAVFRNSSSSCIHEKIEGKFTKESI